ncbi:sporulation protein YunB [Clostridium felsineum]|uniref:Sporulation protein YunB n=2 Tax=Clostridium felsineum TaxID=36839 RepID=A0A1S8L701_9CLOT|nr:sporulation protein YunB [Clostridium felsineum]URZ00174.1 Sporulation protein YunB [Clostridium felsineum]URZ07182.1 Sporulation protein YunB [Clostridium felsineum]URZ12211.1 Sporulation protein YunB [Clostridium felsineum]URZ16804.1 Sporulation protein YunB [Clostridium felsineum DSM 794]
MVYISGKKSKLVIIIILTFMLVLFNSLIYSFDKLITPVIMQTANSDIKSKITEIVNKNMSEVYNKNYDYNKIIEIEKDNEGNIVMMKANTVKLNKLACDLALEAQYDIKKLGEIGIKVPLGYILKNNMLAYMGPKLTIKAQQIGNVETSYVSKFEGAGINQTRHTIMILVKTKVRVMIPMSYDDIEIKNEIPVSETVIVGKIPNSALGLNLKNSGFNIP